MDREQELAVIRRAYAKQIMAVMETEDARVEAAFSEVRREHFLGDGIREIGYPRCERSFIRRAARSSVDGPLIQ